MTVRALVFVVSLAVAMLAFQFLSETSFFFAAVMSVCIAAVVCTAGTASGRVAGRRILHNLGQGWGRGN